MRVVGKKLSSKESAFTEFVTRYCANCIKINPHHNCITINPHHNKCFPTRGFSQSGGIFFFCNTLKINANTTNEKLKVAAEFLA